jgi:Helicase conserved C-terminal domain
MEEKIKKLLLHPQIAHTYKLIDSLYMNGFAFDASGTGCGKTFCASAVAATLNVPVVVICPKIARKNWFDVLNTFGIKPHVVINYEKLIRGNTPYYTFNTKEYVNRKHWYASTGIYSHFPKNSLIVVDECHKARGAKSKNGEMLTALKNHGYKLLLLSATAACNATEMRHFGYATNLHNGAQWMNFAREHGAKNDGFGGLTWTKDDTEAKSGMYKIHDKLFNLQKCANKMSIEDFGNIFPDNRIIAESFDLGNEGSAKLQAVYDTMQAELAALDARAENYSEHIFAVMMRARRHSELLKVPVTAEWIEDRLDAGVSPVAFFNFTDSLQAVYSKLSKFKELITLIVGGQSEKDRNKQIDEFQSNKRKIVLANMNAGAASISLHDVHGDNPRESLICPSWSAIMTLQTIGRIYRANGKSKCIQKFLFASEIEERQRARVASKVRNISELNDGDLSLADTITLY